MNNQKRGKIRVSDRSTVHLYFYKEKEIQRPHIEYVTSTGTHDARASIRGKIKAILKSYLLGFCLRNLKFVLGFFHIPNIRVTNTSLADSLA